MLFWEPVDFSAMRVLVADDEPAIRAAMANAVRGANGEVVGPAETAAAAVSLLDGGAAVDAAMLTVRSDDPFRQLADALQARGVPIVFVAGHDDWFFPDGLHEPPVAGAVGQPREP